MNFQDVVMECLNTPELVREYDRLSGSHLGRVLKATPIEQMVDEATGWNEHEITKFIKFVDYYIWQPL